jgi:hypothetical protein
MPDPAAPPIVRLKIPCSDEREFRERFAPKYVTNGVFVPTERPRKVGTRLHLKIELRDGRIGVSGDAMVTGQTTAGPGGRPGMTLRLTGLHAGSIQFELSPVGGAGPSVASAPRPSVAPGEPDDEPAPLHQELFGPEDEPLDSGTAAKPLEVGTRGVKLKLKETPRVTPAPHGEERLEPLPAKEEPGRPTAPGRRREEAPEPTPAPLVVKAPWRVRGGRRPVVIAAIAMVVAVGGAVAAASSVAARAARARGAQATEEVRMADARILEGRLAGPGGDSALDHLLAAQDLASGDARVTSRLRLLADKFEQFGARAMARGDLREAAVHYQAAVRADPGREGARKKLRDIEARSAPGAQGK